MMVLGSKTAVLVMVLGSKTAVLVVVLESKMGALVVALLAVGRSTLEVAAAGAEH